VNALIYLIVMVIFRLVGVRITVQGNHKMSIPNDMWLAFDFIRKGDLGQVDVASANPHIFNLYGMTFQLRKSRLERLKDIFSKFDLVF
jgi:hypothetical protein